MAHGTCPRLLKTNLTQYTEACWQEAFWKLPPLDCFKMDSLSKDRSPTKRQKAGELWWALLTQWFHYPSLRVICRGKLFNDYKEILFSSQGNNVLHKSYMDFCQVEMLLKTIYLLTRYFFSLNTRGLLSWNLIWSWNA